MTVIEEHVENKMCQLSKMLISQDTLYFTNKERCYNYTIVRGTVFAAFTISQHLYFYFGLVFVDQFEMS